MSRHRRLSGATRTSARASAGLGRGGGARRAGRLQRDAGRHLRPLRVCRVVSVGAVPRSACAVVDLRSGHRRDHRRPGQLQVDLNAKSARLLPHRGVPGRPCLRHRRDRQARGGSDRRAVPACRPRPGALGAALCFVTASFVGFESAAIYGEECKDPQRTVARATYTRSSSSASSTPSRPGRP